MSRKNESAICRIEHMHRSVKKVKAFHTRYHWRSHVASAQNALKVAIFRLKIEKFSGEGQYPLPRPQLIFLRINHNVVSNTLVLSPRAICIHTTASLPTSNGFWRLKRFKQSMEEWTMNCKNSAQNALKVAIFRLEIERFSAEGAMPPRQTPPHCGGDTLSPNPTPSAPRSSRLRRSTLPPVCKSWIRQWLKVSLFLYNNKQ